MLLQLELWNAVAKQSANAICLLVDRDRVSSAAKLLGCCKSRRSGTDDRNFFAGASFRKNGMNPALEKAALDNVLFVLLDRHRWFGDAENARCLARRRTNASGKFREIVRRVKLTDRIFPAPTEDVVIPIGDEIVDGTSGLTERDAAIHAARALLAELFFRKIL